MVAETDAEISQKQNWVGLMTGFFNLGILKEDLENLQKLRMTS